MVHHSIYQDIALRTGGDIYIGVVGPVRTGKSTLIKRIMESIIIPNIEDTYWAERARDELPQSGSGKTIMTAEPKFVPEEAVEISPDGKARLSVRMIDSVGYMVDGAIGATEDGKPRMVTTPWFDHEIPMTEAAELGTKKVMEDHCTIGIVVTTDATVTDIDRADYISAERRAIEDMKATGKPFLVIVNSVKPQGEDAQALRKELEDAYGVSAIAADCQSLSEQELQQIFTAILYEFPMRELQFFLPGWVCALEPSHPLKTALFAAMRQNAESITRLAQTEPAIAAICQTENVQGYHIRQVDLGKGVVSCELTFCEGLFYQILGEKSGMAIQSDADLLGLLEQLSAIKREYDRLENALEEVKATGYGIVLPNAENMHLDVPEIVKKGGAYGVKLHAKSEAIHMIKCDIETEICPMVGDEKQSEDLINYLLGEYEGNTERLWESNIFGKSVYELVNEGLTTKLKRMPDDARYKMRDTISRIINDGCNGLICILL